MMHATLTTATEISKTALDKVMLRQKIQDTRVIIDPLGWVRCELVEGPVLTRAKDLTEQERRFLRAIAGAILLTQEDGTFQVRYYATPDSLRHAWDSFDSDY